MATDEERYVFAITHPTERVQRIKILVQEIARKAAQEAAKAAQKGEL